MPGRARRESKIHGDGWITNPNEADNESTVSRLVRGCTVEFLGDFIFVFIGSLSATSSTGVTGVALAHGLCIFVLIASFGHISGGHFNPAVTIGVLATGSIQIVDGLCYILSQLFGGFMGALLVRAVLTEAQYETGTAAVAVAGAGINGTPISTGVAVVAGINGGVTLPTADNFPEAFICEIVFTFLLVMTVLMTAVDRDTNVLAPLAIGISITVDIFAGGKLSGASMNPARSLGPAIAYSIFGPTNKHWDDQWIYFIGSPIGALISAALYKLLLASHDKRLLLK